jgi:hypothetical protein
MMTCNANETNDSYYSRSSNKVQCSQDSVMASDEKSTSCSQFRKVQFHSRVNCRQFCTSVRNKNDLWYSPSEIRSHSQRDKHLQSIMGMKDTSLLLGDDDNTQDSLSLLGLKSCNERKLRVYRIKQAKASVFEQQACQEEQWWLSLVKGEFRLNQETIAEFYSIYSKKAALLAYMRGLNTARHVEELLNDDCEEDVRHPSKKSNSTFSWDTLKYSPRRASPTSKRIQRSRTLPIVGTNSNTRHGGQALPQRLQRETNPPSGEA